MWSEIYHNSHIVTSYSIRIKIFRTFYTINMAKSKFFQFEINMYFENQNFLYSMHQILISAIELTFQDLLCEKCPNFEILSSIWNKMYFENRNFLYSMLWIPFSAMWLKFQTLSTLWKCQNFDIVVQFGLKCTLNIKICCNQCSEFHFQSYEKCKNVDIVIRILNKIPNMYFENRNFAYSIHRISISAV